MSDYKFKVRITRDMEAIIHAKNKDEAEKEVKSWCKCGWGVLLDERIEVIEVERMTVKKKAQERGSNGKEND